jgi:7,8-dihydropterin-6-yl-methyl-4-(beta-D-ribofuranosyl)aminobenzene 5'-phosphate synthase
MHLLRASHERIEKTVQALDRFQLQIIAAGHCTGLEAVVRLGTALPGRLMECAAGSRFTFPL